MRHLLPLLVLALAGCQSAAMKPSAWQARFDDTRAVLGHRNWIVVADAAYPDQVSPGVETIATGSSQLEVLRAVLGALEAARHVRPIVHLDAELEHVPEDLAPGIGAYRRELRKLLEGRRVVTLPHEEVIRLLDEAGKTFRILILKTDLTIPYTSVFLQLDCGYWGPEPEKTLRQIMRGTE